jgi:hypothetical protein
MHELFKGGTTCFPDAGKYPPRSELDELFRNTRAHTLESLKMFNENDATKPNTDEKGASFFPTVGALWGVIATHPFWHIGQIADCRKRLNKPPALGM